MRPGEGSSVSRTTRQDRSRRLLDSRFERLRPSLVLLSRPPQGWLRSVREALGMSQADLAARLGVNQKTVQRLERSEVDRTAQLNTLQHAADAMDCELVYAIVPRRTLQALLDERISQVAAEHLAAVDHTMLLEDQLPERVDEGRRRQVAAKVAEQSGLWRSGR